MSYLVLPDLVASVLVLSVTEPDPVASADNSVLFKSNLCWPGSLISDVEANADAAESDADFGVVDADEDEYVEE